MSDSAPGMQAPRPWLAVLAASLAGLLIATNTTTVNAAINDIADDLALDTETLSWVVNAYLVASAALVAFAGPLGDRIGLRAVFYTGPIPRDGPSAPIVIGSFAIALVCISVFGAWSARRPAQERFFDLRLFRYPPFIGGCVISFAAFGAIFSVFYFYNLYSQSVVVLDQSALIASIALLPFGVTLFVMSILVGRITDAVGARLPLAIGTVTASIGFLLLADIPTGDCGAQLLIGLALASIGVGGIYVTAAASGLSAIPRDLLGEAAGVINTMRYAGGSIAVAIGATLYVTVGVGTFNSKLQAGGEPAAAQDQLDNALTGTNDGLENALDELPNASDELVASSAEAAITDGFRAAMAVLAVLMIAATIAAATTLGRRRAE